MAFNASHRRWTILAVVLVMLGYLATPIGVVRALAEVILFGGCAAAVVSAIGRHRPSRPAPWVGVSVGLASFGVSSWWWAIESLTQPGGLATALEVVFDVLGFGGFTYAALAFLTALRAGRDRDRLLDAATVVLAGVLLGWQWLALDFRMGGSVGPLTIGMALLFTGSLGFVVRFLSMPREGGRPISAILLLLAVVIVVPGNLLDSFWVAPGPPSWLDVFFVLGALLATLAALDPSMSQTAVPIGANEPRPLGRVIGLAAALVVNPLLVVLWSVRQGADPVGLGLGVTALTIVVLWRITHLVAEREHSHAALEASEQRIRSLVQHVADTIIVVDPEGRITYVSPAVESLIQRHPNDVVGTMALSYLQPEDRSQMDAQLYTARHAATPPQTLPALDVRLRDAGGIEHWVEAIVSDRSDVPGVDGYVVTLREVTERRALEAELTRQAYTDALTGLANRAHFMHVLEAVVERSNIQPAGPQPGLLFCDLDKFKQVNDHLGHGAGDQVLRNIARRLQDSVRGADVAARLGGDEFAVLLDAIGNPEELYHAAGHVLEELHPHRRSSDVRQVPMTVSIGAAWHRPGQSASDLLRAADLAMYTAKSHGTGRIEVFDPSMDTGRVEVQPDLSLAVEHRHGPPARTTR